MVTLSSCFSSRSDAGIDVERGKAQGGPPGVSQLQRHFQSHKGKLLLLGVGALGSSWLIGAGTLGVLSLGVTIPFSTPLILGLFVFGIFLFGCAWHAGSTEVDAVPEKKAGKPRGKRCATLYFERPSQRRAGLKKSQGV